MTNDLHVFTPYGATGASARVRVFDWLSYLQLQGTIHSYMGKSKAGVSTIVHNPLAAIRAEIDLRRTTRSSHQRVLLHREASPLSGGQLEKRLLASAAFSAYDIDDAMQWDWGDPGGLRRLLPKAHKTVQVVKDADRVIAGNATLADWASCWAREVVCIPSCVDPSAYWGKNTYTLNDPPRLVWIGTPVTERYLQLIEDALLEVTRRTGARLMLISSGDAPLGRLGQIIDRIEWSERTAEKALSQWDIGLMPLAEGLNERGKSGYKLLQYGAAKLPAVATPIGINREILSLFGAPRPESSSEWVDAILALLEAPESTREALGGRAHDVVKERYSYEAWAGRWRRAVLEP